MSRADYIAEVDNYLAQMAARGEPRPDRRIFDGLYAGCCPWCDMKFTLRDMSVDASLAHMENEAPGASRG